MVRIVLLFGAHRNAESTPNHIPDSPGSFLSPSRRTKKEFMREQEVAS